MNGMLLKKYGRKKDTILNVFLFLLEVMNPKLISLGIPKKSIHQ